MRRAISAIRDILIDRGEFLAVAESVTAGHIQAGISNVKKAMDFFAGGITVYNLDQKVEQLHVDQAHARRVDCVSERVACEMAMGAAKIFESDWAIATTGYAATVPEKRINSLFAWVAISYKKKIISAKKVRLGKLSPQMAQQAYKNHALRLLLRSLKSKEHRK